MPNIDTLKGLLQKSVSVRFRWAPAGLVLKSAQSQHQLRVEVKKRYSYSKRARAGEVAHSALGAR